MHQTEFIATKAYKRFVEFCQACKKDKYIGLCYGAAGVGKSVAATHFARWHQVWTECQYVKSSPYAHPPLKMDDFDTIIYIPDVINSPTAIRKAIEQLILDFNQMVNRSLSLKDRLSTGIGANHVKLLIIDEADRLQPKSLEEVRDIYDRQQVPVILVGMPGIEKRLIRFPQLYSRVGFSHLYQPLNEEEIGSIVQDYMRVLNIAVDVKNVSDHEAIAAFNRITQGNFRLINRLLKQTVRIMAVNLKSNMSKEVVEAARECLVIGNVY
jgi:DNA transposition AAA+ family ATPase